MEKTEYRVICFCGENEIFVGVVESYILANRYQKNPDVETLQFFRYNDDTKYAIIDYSGDFGSLFGIYEGDIKIIPETNHFHFAIEDIPEFDTGELGYFQLEPNKGIWIENGGYATGRFRLIEGKEKVIPLLNSLL
jgi:hypothetical protein